MATKGSTKGKIAAVKGGTTKMFGKTGAGQEAPGTTAKKSGMGPKFAQGGNTPMFGFSGSKPATPSC
jgi:hypothetical protein